jgi:hypothetical protein
MSAAPPFAFFRHPDGRWYRLWATRTAPKTARGHPWHVHATYDQSGASAPVAGTRWYDQPYGMANWDFDTEDAARAEFRRRAAARLARGYELLEGALPDDPRARAVTKRRR